MDGIAAIGQRMAQIQATISSLAPRTTSDQLIGVASTSATAFGAVLDREVTAATAGTAAAVAPTSGTLNADGVPSDLATYGNGKIPSSALGEVGNTGEKLWAPAASSMGSLLAAASRDGVPITISDAYRSYDEQVSLAKSKGLYSKGGLAAAPGTSNHGWGLSVDLKLSSSAQAWMQKNAGTYGFTNDVSREPWHWTYGQS